MTTIAYRLYLEQPLLATAPQGDQNSAVSYDYIPGSLVRGALIGRYHRQAASADLAADPAARRLFFDGTTLFLHAYPLAECGGRTVPTPLALLREKDARIDDRPTA